MLLNVMVCITGWKNVLLVLHGLELLVVLLEVVEWIFGIIIIVIIWNVVLHALI